MLHLFSFYMFTFPKSFKKNFFLFFILLPLCHTFSQWQMMDGPHRVPEMSYIISNSKGDIFAVDYSEETSLYKSTDNGTSWDLNYKYNSFIVSLSLGPNDQIYAGTYGGYYLSTDDGSSWEFKEISSFHTWIQLVKFNSLGQIFLGTTNGIWKSTDQGNSWDEVFISGSVTGLAIDSNNNIYAGVETLNRGLYKSTDNGQTWQLKVNGMGVRQMSNIEIDKDEEIFAGTRFYGLYKSTNYGEDWIQVYDEMVYEFNIDNFSNIYILSCIGIQFSSDEGNNWINTGLTGICVEDISFIDDTAFVASNNGIYYSAIDSICWALSPLYGELAKVLDIERCDNIFLASTSQMLFKYENNSWQQILPYAAKLIIKDTLSQKVYLFHDSLSYTEDCGDHLNSFPVSGSYFYPVNRDTLYVYTTCQKYVSTDGGNTWEESNLNFCCYTFYDVLRTNSGDWYFAGYINSPPYYPSMNFLRYSTDNGISWPIIYGEKAVYTIALLEDKLFIGTNNAGILMTTDNGQNWITRNNGLNSLVVNKIIINPDNKLLAATNSGVYFSVDEGENWIPIDNSGLLSTVITNLYVELNGRIYACTQKGIGEFRGVLTVPTNISRSELDFNLLQNYPNPFNSSTTISFSLVERSQVNISIFNSLGEKLLDLMNEEKEAGSHNIIFNADMLSSGVYFYRIIMGSFIENKKMILTK